jgi:hypothetical protein
MGDDCVLHHLACNFLCYYLLGDNLQRCGAKEGLMTETAAMVVCCPLHATTAATKACLQTRRACSTPGKLPHSTYASSPHSMQVQHCCCAAGPCVGPIPEHIVCWAPLHQDTSAASSRPRCCCCCCRHAQHMVAARLGFAAPPVMQLLHHTA